MTTINLETDINLIPVYERVVQLVARGQANAAIAKSLSVAEKTVENYMNAIYHQVGIPTDGTFAHRVMLALWWWHRKNLRGGVCD